MHQNYISVHKRWDRPLAWEKYLKYQLHLKLKYPSTSSHFRFSQRDYERREDSVIMVSKEEKATQGKKKLEVSIKQVAFLVSAQDLAVRSTGRTEKLVWD